jgi:nucleotide-binding universal stress UspA family protein
MISHILFPSDLSVPTQAAFKQLLELANAFKAKVTLFHAYQLLSTSVVDLYALSYNSAMQELEKSMAERALTHLGDFTKQLTEAGIETEMLIERGNPGELIVAMAKKQGCDLIMMGSRGLGPMRSVLMSSTSSYVLHHSHCPILVIPTPKA